MINIFLKNYYKATKVNLTKSCFKIIYDLIGEIRFAEEKLNRKGTAIMMMIEILLGTKASQ